MVRYALQRVGAMARFRRAGWQSNWMRAWLGTGTGEQPRLCCANLRHVLPQRGDRRRVNAMLRQRGARDALVGCQGVRDVEQREETVGCECPEKMFDSFVQNISDAAARVLSDALVCSRAL